MNDLANLVAMEMTDETDVKFIDPATILIIIQLISVILPILKERCGWDAAKLHQAAKDTLDKKVGWRVRKAALRLMIRVNLDSDYQHLKGSEIADAFVAVSADTGSITYLQQAMAA